MKKQLFVAAVLIAFASFGIAQDKHTQVTPDAVIWKDNPAFPKGVQVAALVGDPTKAGDTVVLRIKFPANFEMPPHTHPYSEVVTIVSGAIGTSQGEKFEKKGELLKPGALWVYPAKHAHYAWTGDEEAVLQVQFTGPGGIDYINPADDPRKQMTSVSMPEESKFVVEPVVETKVTELPPGPLFWRLENFSALTEAQNAAGPTSLAAEVAGKVWLFTLGPKDGATPGGTKVAEIGPLPPISASEYLLRVNRAGGPPGAKTSIHTHPGPEAFYVLTGKLGQRTPHGVTYTEAGATMTGHGADTPMEVFNAGTTDLDELAIFVVDANKPFSSPASLD